MHSRHPLSANDSRPKRRGRSMRSAGPIRRPCSTRRLRFVAFRPCNVRLPRSRVLREAASRLVAILSEALFFTDDPDAVQQEFRVGRSQIVGPDDIHSPLDTLLTMARAEALVIPNSTFSWWAAELAGSVRWLPRGPGSLIDWHSQARALDRCAELVNRFRSLSPWLAAGQPGRSARRLPDDVRGALSTDWAGRLCAVRGPDVRLHPLRLGNRSFGHGFPPRTRRLSSEQEIRVEEARWVSASAGAAVLLVAFLALTLAPLPLGPPGEVNTLILVLGLMAQALVQPLRGRMMCAADLCANSCYRHNGNNPGVRCDGCAGFARYVSDCALRSTLHDSGCSDSL